MAVIHVLEPSVYNRIAAGEVVERPYSVVKELVENAIDAGATQITVSVYDGGISRIRVSDNGCGIEKEQLNKVFLPHATSKIQRAEDLDNILTLGFRGEALASIASVAQVSVRSRAAGRESGSEICCNGGEMTAVSDCAAVQGTEITVDRLFFNTPVRAKFLKTARSEESDITALMHRLILGNPDIAFRYYTNDKLSAQSFGTGMEEAMISVYGAKVIQDCFYIDTERNSIRIRGYIGKHHFTKPNRTYQTLFVNGRYVVNASVGGAIQNAYASYLMKRQYPFFVLSLGLPTEEVDVNVHPNKTEIRFQNNQKVFGSIYAVVSAVLDGTSQAVSIVKEASRPIPASAPVSAAAVRQNAQKSLFHAPPADLGARAEVKKSQQIKPTASVAGPSVSDESKNRFRLSFADSMPQQARATVKSTMPKPQQSVEVSVKPADKADEKIAATVQAPVKKPVAEQKSDISAEFLYAGQVLHTYLLFERGDDVYLVDQHAAHERLNYDAYLSAVSTGEVATQQMLIPFILTVNASEYEFLAEQITLLLKMGFEIEEFGKNTFRIGAVPVVLDGISLQKFFDSLLNDGAAVKKDVLPEILLDKIAQKACKASVKAGKVFTRDEAVALIKRMRGDMGLKCPHGRPVAVRLAKTEIEKWFKRIV